jgi:pimeloyl-ACP methyl ester carboxylesterase
LLSVIRHFEDSLSMLARWLRILTIVELIGAGAIAWRLAVGGLPVAGAVAIGLATPLLVHGAIIAFDFALAAWAGSPTPAPQRLGPAAATGLFLREWRDSVLVFQVIQPWLAPRPLPGELNPGRPGRTPVLLIHGFFCNRQLWRPLARWLNARGHPLAAVDLEPVLGSIDDYVPAIEAAVAALQARTGASAVALVGHSMGGLAARAYVRRHGGKHVSVMVSIGTPHHGTFHARLGHGHNARQMRPDSEWLRALAADEAAQGPASLPCTTVILSHHDNIVAPQSDQTLPYAQRTHELAAIGHLSLAFDRTVWSLVGEALDTPREDPARIRSGSLASAAGTQSDRH